MGCKLATPLLCGSQTLHGAGEIHQLERFTREGAGRKTVRARHLPRHRVTLLESAADGLAARAA